MKYTKQEIGFCKEKLLELINNGTTVYTVLRHKSASGMSRTISMFIIEAECGATPSLSCIDYQVSRVLGERIDNKTGGIKVSGCGMDMGFHLVHNLQYALFGVQSKNELKHQWI